MAELARIAAGGAQHPVEGEVAQRLDAEVGADLLDRMIGRDQLVARRGIDAVVARSRDRRRGDAEMHFAGAGVADHLHQLFAGGAPHQRVVYDDDLLPLEHFAHRVELDLDLGAADLLRRMNERAPDVVVADQRVLELQPRLFRITQRHGIGGIGHREHTVGARGGVLARQLASQRPAHAVHRAAEDGAVGPGEVHQLEDAAMHRLGRQRGEPLHLPVADAHEIAGLQLAHRLGADQVERARLRGHHVPRAEATQPQRPEPARIDDGVQGAADGDHQ